jgi:nitrite reductase/ring-hydroxylating ferredoxin subunit
MLGSDGWVPAVRSAELVGEHVAVAQLHDADIALWRDAGGRANAWENRCPHRGMRLSLGSATADSLVCRYHGWRFASGSGACSFIPAHPRQTAPKAAVVQTYRTCEKYGFVWVGSDNVTGQPHIAGIAGESYLTFRSLTFHAPAGAVRQAMGHAESAGVFDDGSIRVRRTIGDLGVTAVVLVVPRTPQTTIVHGFAAAAVPESMRLPLLRLHNDRLKTLRTSLEADRRVPAGVR